MTLETMLNSDLTLTSIVQPFIQNCLSKVYKSTPLIGQSDNSCSSSSLQATCRNAPTHYTVLCVTLDDTK